MKNRRLNAAAFVRSTPCVTICMNTPGCQSDNSQFTTELSRLADQAKFLVLEKYRSIQPDPIIEKLNAVPGQISFTDHLKSLTIYVHEGATEVIFSMWPVAHNRVQVSDRFDIRPLVNIANNTEEYIILLLSHKKVKLLKAVNNKVIYEIKQCGFPITGSLRLLARNFKSGNEYEEETLHTFLSGIDGALIALYNTLGLRYVVASSEDNYERFSHVARFRSIYLGHIVLSNDLTYKNIASEAWALLQKLQKEERLSHIQLVKELMAQGRVLTRPEDIIKAAREGRGDLLVVNDALRLPDEDEDLICEAVWDVVSKHGRVLLAEDEEAEEIGTMALKLKF